MNAGRVISIRGKMIHIFSNDTTIICTLKNSIWREKTNQKNAIAIGDHVVFNEHNQIVEIKERKTILQRTDPLNPRKRQVLGANIDQVYITFAIHSPDIDITMLDRYIMAAQKGNLTPIVVINKIDLALSNDQIEDLCSIYKNIGIEVFPISTYTKDGIEPLIESLSGKTSMLSGPSGAGKTSLINIIAKKDLEVGIISEKIQKGKHTTTFSSLIPLNKDTFIIDTPGIASFSVYDLTEQDISLYFSDLNNPLGPCKFRTCTHTHEPGCMVKKAAEEHLISAVRFASHQEIISTLLSKDSQY